MPPPPPRRPRHLHLVTRAAPAPPRTVPVMPPRRYICPELAAALERLLITDQLVVVGAEQPNVDRLTVAPGAATGPATLTFRPPS